MGRLEHYSTRQIKIESYNCYLPTIRLNGETNGFSDASRLFFSKLSFNVMEIEAFTCLSTSSCGFLESFTCCPQRKLDEYENAYYLK